ncbi:MAG: putative inositol monophosphatase family protein [Candidatus Bathyarchaeota archaeon B63]|nr:MAG: putative inositol monophosphatase family protein [Candidatus Bathyarchaeota archaeon B63]
MTRIGLDVLVEMARSVSLSVNRFLGLHESGRKMGIGFGGDYTRLIDKIAEEAIVKYLEENDLSCILIGEEGGIRRIGRNPEEYLITDAIDGTTNAIRGIRFASTSLAVASEDRLGGVEAAAVLSLYDGRLYTAEKGKGARLDGRLISPSETTRLEESMVSVDVSSTPSRLSRAIPIIKAAKRVRSFGSASLEICHVASGLLDAHVDLRGKIRTLDFAAAMLILRESGGSFGLLNGDEPDETPLTRLRRFSIIAAANEALYSQILSLIL